jgi:hypothetical protein
VSRPPYVRWQETGSGWMDLEEARRAADRLRERDPRFEFRVKGNVLVGYRVQGRARRQQEGHAS